MGRKVANNYQDGATPTHALLRIVSPGYYDIVIHVDKSMLESMYPYSWCLDQGKGQVYTMDLTMALPTLLGFKTPRVYLRDFVLYKQGLFGQVIWRRPDLCDYRFALYDTVPIASSSATK